MLSPQIMIRKATDYNTFLLVWVICCLEMHKSEATLVISLGSLSWA